MEKLTARKQRVLDAMDEEIQELEEKLKKAQPLMDELNQLRRSRAILLSERSVTGGVGANGTGMPRLTMEEVIHALRENDNEPMSVNDLAAALGRNEATVRSHLNRNRDSRYEKNADQEWNLIGEEDE